MFGYVVLKMTWWRNVAPLDASFRTRTLSRISFGVAATSRGVVKATKIWREVTGFNGRWRKHWVRPLGLLLVMTDSSQFAVINRRTLSSRRWT